MDNNVQENNVVQPKKSSKKVAIIVSSLVGALLIGAIGIFVYFVMSAKKFECTSEKGSITIMYTEKKLVGYKTKNYKYDLDGQQKIANEVGVEEYLNQFGTWWKTNTGGTCTRK